MTPFLFLKSLTEGADACGPKLGGGEVCRSKDVGKGSMIFKGIVLSTGSSMVTFIFLLDEIGRASYLKDFLLFFPFKEPIPCERSVTFWELAL